MGFPDPEAPLRPELLLWDRMKLNLSTSELHCFLQISQPPNIVQKRSCIQNSQMDLSFQKNKTVVCISVTQFTSYNNSCDTVFKRPVAYAEAVETSMQKRVNHVTQGRGKFLAIAEISSKNASKRLF